MYYSMKFDEGDPAACWFREQLLDYASGEDFEPENHIDRNQLLGLMDANVKKAAENSNMAFNPNDKTAVRKNRQKF